MTGPTFQQNVSEIGAVFTKDQARQLALTYLKNANPQAAKFIEGAPGDLHANGLGKGKINREIDKFINEAFGSNDLASADQIFAAAAKQNVNIGNSKDALAQMSTFVTAQGFLQDQNGQFIAPEVSQYKDVVFTDPKLAEQFMVGLGAKSTEVDANGVNQVEAIRKRAEEKTGGALTVQAIADAAEVVLGARENSTRLSGSSYVAVYKQEELTTAETLLLPKEFGAAQLEKFATTAQEKGGLGLSEADAKALVNTALGGKAATNDQHGHTTPEVKASEKGALSAVIDAYNATDAGKTAPFHFSQNTKSMVENIEKSTSYLEKSVSYEAGKKILEKALVNAGLPADDAAIKKVLDGAYTKDTKENKVSTLLSSLEKLENEEAKKAGKPATINLHSELSAEQITLVEEDEKKKREKKDSGIGGVLGQLITKMFGEELGSIIMSFLDKFMNKHKEETAPGKPLEGIVPSKDEREQEEKLEKSVRKMGKKFSDKEHEKTAVHLAESTNMLDEALRVGGTVGIQGAQMAIARMEQDLAILEGKPAPAVTPQKSAPDGSAMGSVNTVGNLAVAGGVQATTPATGAPEGGAELNDKAKRTLAKVHEKIDVAKIALDRAAKGASLQEAYKAAEAERVLEAKVTALKNSLTGLEDPIAKAKLAVINEMTDSKGVLQVRDLSKADMEKLADIVDTVAKSNDLTQINNAVISTNALAIADATVAVRELDGHLQVSMHQGSATQVINLDGADAPKIDKDGHFDKRFSMTLQVNGKEETVWFDTNDTAADLGKTIDGLSAVNKNHVDIKSLKINAETKDNAYVGDRDIDTLLANPEFANLAAAFAKLAKGGEETSYADNLFPTQGGADVAKTKETGAPAKTSTVKS